VASDEGVTRRERDQGGGKKGDARYANSFQIGHNAFEFLLEFGQHEARIHTRIYVSPQHARMFADLLSESLRKYEAAFGPMPSIHERLER